VAWFRRQAQTSGELEKVQLALVALQVELDRERADSLAVRRRVQDLEAAQATAAETAVAAPTTSLIGTGPLDPSGSVHWGTPAPDTSLDDVRRLAESVSATTATHGDQLSELRSRLVSVDARLDELTHALTNQLAELGHDVERLEAGRTDASPEHPAAVTDVEVSAARLEELRTNQVRIANEQARFAKALHEQLAELADELRRSTR
jgi:DNA repair exonuclease SbcCD ATPase subunit